MRPLTRQLLLLGFLSLVFNAIEAFRESRSDWYCVRRNPGS